MTWIDKRRVRVRAGEFALVDEGDPEAPPVVLLSGGITSSYAWRRLIPLLSPFMHVIAPDLLGSGDSEAADGADLRLPSHADHVRALLRALGVERFAVVGHGHGGGVAQLLALDGNVDALVLIDAIAFDAWPAQRVRELNTQLDQLDAEDVETWLSEMLDAGTKRAQLTTADVHEYVRPFAGPGGLERFRRVIASFDGDGLTDLEPRFAGLEIPVFIVWGEDDTFVMPENAERLADVLPWSSVALLPGCGHFLLEDAADTVAPLIFKWFQRQYLKVEHRHEADAGPVVVSLGRRPPGEE
ncbi:MAG: alpha/beta fold hydrolase [Actinomycetota bacterium]